MRDGPQLARHTAHAPRIVVELEVEFTRENCLELVQAVVAAAADKEGGGLQASDDDSGDVVDGGVANLQNKTGNELQMSNQTSAYN
jgi:hypothetical protein